MTRLEHVADRIRRQHAHDCHRPGLLPWAALTGHDQRPWLRMATAALDADSTWRGGADVYSLPQPSQGASAQTSSAPPPPVTSTRPHSTDSPMP